MSECIVRKKRIYHEVFSSAQKKIRKRTEYVIQLKTMVNDQMSKGKEKAESLRKILHTIMRPQREVPVLDDQNCFEGVYYTLDEVMQTASIIKISTVCFAVGDGAGNLMIPSIVQKDAIRYGVRMVLTEAFRDCAFLKSIRLPSSMQSIGAYAFRNCLSLEQIVLPASISHIQSLAFSPIKDKAVITMLHTGADIQCIAEAAFAFASNDLSVVYLHVADDTFAQALGDHIEQQRSVGAILAAPNAQYGFYSKGECIALCDPKKDRSFGGYDVCCHVNGETINVSEHGFQASLSFPEKKTKQEIRVRLAGCEVESYVYCGIWASITSCQMENGLQVTYHLRHANAAPMMDMTLYVRIKVDRTTPSQIHKNTLYLKKDTCIFKAYAEQGIVSCEPTVQFKWETAVLAPHTDYTYTMHYDFIKQPNK